MKAHNSYQGEKTEPCARLGRTMHWDHAMSQLVAVYIVSLQGKYMSFQSRTKELYCHGPRALHTIAVQYKIYLIFGKCFWCFRHASNSRNDSDWL